MQKKQKNKRMDRILNFQNISQNRSNIYISDFWLFTCRIKVKIRVPHMVPTLVCQGP